MNFNSKVLLSTIFLVTGLGAAGCGQTKSSGSEEQTSAAKSSLPAPDITKTLVEEKNGMVTFLVYGLAADKLRVDVGSHFEDPAKRLLIRCDAGRQAPCLVSVKGTVAVANDNQRRLRWDLNFWEIHSKYERFPGEFIKLRVLVELTSEVGALWEKTTPRETEEEFYKALAQYRKDGDFKWPGGMATKETGNYVRLGSAGFVKKENVQDPCDPQLKKVEKRFEMFIHDFIMHTRSISVEYAFRYVNLSRIERAWLGCMKPFGL